VAIAVRLEGLSDHPQLARVSALPLEWWLIRPDQPGAGARPDQAVARATSRIAVSGDAGEWVARLEGDRGAVDYALAVIPGAFQTLSGRGRDRILGGLDDLQARSLLDAAETVALSVVLVRTTEPGATAVAEAIAGGGTPGEALSSSLAIVKPAGVPWSVVGTRPGTPPPNLPGLAVLEHSAEPLPGAATVSLEPPSARRLPVWAAAAVLVVVLAGGVGLWRLEDGSPAMGPTQAHVGGVTGASCDVWTTETAGVPTTAGGSATAQDEDETGDPVVLFGGVGNESKTWLWSGSTQRWALARPAVAPPGRSGAALAYDPTSHDLLLFGGVLANGQPANDTWTWNGCTWRREPQNGPAPPGGQTVGMVWDDALNRLVLLTYDRAAGPGAPGATQTWTWNGSGWSLSAPADRSPAAQALVVAGDPVTGWPIAVSLNGTQAEPDAPSSTWTWDGTTWRTVTTDHSPQAGAPSAMAIDPTTNQLVLTGPSRQPGSSANQTWTWDGQDWSLLGPYDPEHSAPIPAAAVDDSFNGMLETFGWASDAAAPRPLHVWARTVANSWVRLADGTDGALINSSQTPPGGTASTAYDEADHQLVLFGGVDASGRQTLDTWTFDGTAWTRRSTAVHPPAPGSMVYDPFNGTVVLVVNADQTWEWNGSTWRLLRTRSSITGFTGGYLDGLVADPANRTIVALTSCCGSGPPKREATWTWDGSTWTLQHPRNELPAGPELVVAYDALSHTVIAVGNAGTIGPALTWAWDGSTWTQLNPKSGATFDPTTSVMATDPEDGTVVLLGTAFGDDSTDVWSGSIWTNNPGVVPAGAVTFRADAAMYYDDILGDVVLVGAADGSFSEEWLWTSQAWLQLDPSPAG